MISAINRLRAKKGFTIIELIVVIGILGVLTAMIVPALSYDNKPTIGKGIAKDVFYTAQDAFSSAKIAYPDAVTGGGNTIFYATVDVNGVVTDCGTISMVIVSNGDGTVSITLDTPTSFPDTDPTNDKEKLYKKVKEAFKNYTTRAQNMEGMLFTVMDEHFRARVAYWVEGYSLTDGAFAEPCVLRSGGYCCAYPTAYCEAGAVMFPIFS